LRALARENPNIKHLTCHVTIDIHKKKWTSHCLVWRCD
jgi:hypothetical protein